MATLVRVGVIWCVSASAVSCATTGRWPPGGGGDDSRKVAEQLIDETVTVEPRPSRAAPAEARPESLRLLALGATAIQGETEDGLRTIPLSEVQSIWRRKRLSTAIGGGLLGLVLGSLLGSVAANHSGTNCSGDIGGTCLAIFVGGAATGVIVGTAVGALIGYKVSLIVEPPAERSPDAKSK